MKGPFAVFVKRTPGGLFKITGLYMAHPRAKRAGRSDSHCRDREDAVKIARVHISRMMPNGPNPWGMRKLSGKCDVCGHDVSTHNAYDECTR